MEIIMEVAAGAAAKEAAALLVAKWLSFVYGYAERNSIFSPYSYILSQMKKIRCRLLH